MMSFRYGCDGSNPAKRVSAQGYKWCFVSENVWSSFRKPETTLSEELARKAMDGWKKSPSHNATRDFEPANLVAGPN
jgi:uncharacterized protein YkwD